MSTDSHPSNVDRKVDPTKKDPEAGRPVYYTEPADDSDGESFDAVPEGNRRLGTLSATMLIANRMIGTVRLFSGSRCMSYSQSLQGIFATPASIVGATGSIGLALFMWVIGSIIAAAGLAVYLV